MSNEKLWLTEAMQKFNKKFHKGVLNIVNAPAGSGKSTFIFSDLIHESWKYVEGMKDQTTYAENLDRVLYVTDTTMLKDSILQSNKGTTKVLEKGDLAKVVHSKNETEIEDMINGFTGKIKVITYSTLGWLLQFDKARFCLLHFDLVIFDEMQNLFKYSYKFDTKENPIYNNVIENINNFLLNRVLTIALSATPYPIVSALARKVMFTHIFIDKELKLIRKYTEYNKIITHNIMNILKDIVTDSNYFKKYGAKIFIYTNTIAVSKKYKEFLNEHNFTAEWLCSINNKTTNEAGEKIPTMSKKQLDLREKLLQDGTLPNDLDVLIVNSGYETGWNLYDANVQFALIDSIKPSEQIQARNRIRHDICKLYVKVRCNEKGIVLEKDVWGNDHQTDESCSMFWIANRIEKQYIGKKLTTKDKKYLVDTYAILDFDDDRVSWQTFKVDLENGGFDVQVNSKNGGTYIYRRGENMITDNENKLIKWIEKEWDKRRITIADIRDILDLGVRTFDKLLKSENIIQYFKEHRYKIGIPKGTKSKYLMKY